MPTNAAVEVLSREHILKKVLSVGIRGGIGVRFLVQLGSTCRGVRLAASKLVDQRAVERIATLMPTWQWVDLASATWTDEPTITSRVRAVVHIQARI